MTLMKSSNCNVSFPLGNSITVGVLELVICWELLLLPPAPPLPVDELPPAIALFACYKRLFADEGPAVLPLNLFLGGIMVGLLSSVPLEPAPPLSSSNEWPSLPPCWLELLAPFYFVGGKAFFKSLLPAW